MANNREWEKEKQKYIDISYKALKTHFHSKESFLSQLKSETIENRNKFLKLTVIYALLVKKNKVNLEGKSPDEFIEVFVHDTFNFVSIMALIEALYSEVEFLTFYEWLRSSKQQSYFPIEDSEKLKLIFEKDYTNYHGSVKSVVRFFRNIPENYQWILERKLTHYKINDGPKKGKKAIKEKPDIDRIAKILYQIRCDFLHRGKLISEFSGIPTLSKRKRYIISSLTIEDLCVLFEISVLDKFGFDLENISLKPINQYNSKERKMPEQTKQCPYCAETIKAAAIICRFCNRELAKGSTPIKTVNVQKALKKYAKHLVEKGWTIESMTEKQFIATKRESLSGIVALFGFIGLLFFLIPGLLILLIGYVARGTETLIVTDSEAQAWIAQEGQRVEEERQRVANYEKKLKAKKEGRRIANEKKIKELAGSPLRFWYKMSYNQRVWLIWGTVLLVLVILAYLSNYVYLNFF